PPSIPSVLTQPVVTDFGVTSLPKRNTMANNTNIAIANLTNEIVKLRADFAKEREQWNEERRALMSLLTKLQDKLDKYETNVVSKKVPTKKQPVAPQTPSVTSTSADSIHAPANKLTFAKVAAKNVPAKKQTKTKVSLETIQRTLSPATGPSSYTFVYLACRRHLRHSEVRNFLGVLKVPQSRIIDVQFPARGTVALLVHADFKSELVSLLTENKVPVKPAFDPTNAVILGDSKLASSTITERTNLARKIYQDRMLRTCLRLPQELFEQYLQQRRPGQPTDKPASEPLTIADFQDPASNYASSDVDLAMDGSGEIFIDVPVEESDEDL
ncbi:hypothetical protein EC973_006610, partial [Apophysomyces ossiformis]